MITIIALLGYTVGVGWTTAKLAMSRRQLKEAEAAYLLACRDLMACGWALRREDQRRSQGKQ